MSRVVTALLLFPIAFFAIFFASQPVFIAVVLLFAALCYHEFAGLAANHGVSGPLWVGHIAGLLFAVMPDTARLSAILILALALGLKELPKVLPFAASVLLGTVYVYGGWRSGIDLRSISPYWLLFALSVNWAGDIAAYYFGRTFGRHKLFPRVSPGKSWEGAGASMFAAVGLGALMRYQNLLNVPYSEVLALAAVSNVAGQVGDLVESAMKRGAGMKDSGTILPGHGGILDRLDSSLLTMPIVYYYLMYRGYFLP